MVVIPPNSQAASRVSHLTPALMASVVASRSDRSLTIEPPPTVSRVERETVVGKSIPGPQITRLATSTTRMTANPPTHFAQFGKAPSVPVAADEAPPGSPWAGSTGWPVESWVLESS